VLLSTAVPQGAGAFIHRITMISDSGLLRVVKVGKFHRFPCRDGECGFEAEAPLRCRGPACPHHSGRLFGLDLDGFAPAVAVKTDAELDFGWHSTSPPEQPRRRIIACGAAFLVGGPFDCATGTYTCYEKGGRGPNPIGHPIFEKGILQFATKRGVTCPGRSSPCSTANASCGGECPPCPDGEHCDTGVDCASGHCSASSVPCIEPQVKVCIPTHCFDGIKDGGETDVDCGDTCAQGCATGQACASCCDCITREAAGRRPCPDTTCSVGICQLPSSGR